MTYVILSEGHCPYYCRLRIIVFLFLYNVSEVHRDTYYPYCLFSVSLSISILDCTGGFMAVRFKIKIGDLLVFTFWSDSNNVTWETQGFSVGQI